MKFKSFNRVLAALLMLTMLAGQVLMSTAMALNEEPGIVILDESDLLEAEPTPTPTPGPQEEWQEDGAVHEGIDKAESTPEVINEEYIISEQTPAPASSAGIAALPCQRRERWRRRDCHGPNLRQLRSPSGSPLLSQGGIQNS